MTSSASPSASRPVGSSPPRLSNGSTATLVTNGAWALNRFFDKASTSPGAGSLSRQATFNVDGHQVTLEFAPNSIRNPFQLPRFSCP